ncbi:hypothetical protein ESOMN_v1c03390 [Williamsoniiplasma somnilux]|uniref:Uncharacterized protein n=1 Tax=Williamsoniiplasma somnilux TaxID=215578 RepID=A0A2K8P140_9MOLU|nr:ETX/MTX2 family pore-forming toxin [Williamsoniiplasma somnilux]ATZ18721.1 hypothetical protein ESOMN_v1c03390 [Williamsoniiplasma somnilux]
MKFLLPLLLTSSIAAGTAGSLELNRHSLVVYNQEHDNLLKKAADDDPYTNYKSVPNLLSEYVELYIRELIAKGSSKFQNAYLDELGLDFYIFQIMAPSGGDAILKHEKLLSSQKNLVHTETDTLTNNTDSPQTLKSAGYSWKRANSLTSTTSGNAGVIMEFPIKIFTFKLNLNIQYTHSITTTTDITLTSPEQSILVQPHSTRKITSKLYENKNSYNYIVNHEVFGNYNFRDIKIHFGFKARLAGDKNFTFFALDLKLYDFFNSIFMAIGKKPSENDSFYYKGDDNNVKFYLNVPIKVDLLENSLEVVLN